MGADTAYLFCRMGGAILGGDVRGVMAAPCADIRVLPPPTAPGAPCWEGPLHPGPVLRHLESTGGAGDDGSAGAPRSPAWLNSSEPRGREASEPLRRPVNAGERRGERGRPGTDEDEGARFEEGAVPKERRGAQDGSAHGGLSAPYSAAPPGNGPRQRQPGRGGFGVCGGTRPGMSGRSYGAARRLGGGGTGDGGARGGREGGKTAPKAGWGAAPLRGGWSGRGHALP